MAENYILNVKPTISNSDGRKMENDLNKRFSRVAQKFGGALRTVGSKLRGMIAGGAVAGVTAMMANPLDNLNQSLDETLRNYDDIASRAKQLGVSSGQLYQATAIAQSAGIQPDDFRSILTAYAVKRGEAVKGDDMMLQEFIGQEDTITSFFQFLKSLQGLDPESRMYYASKVIGEDDSAKLAELINTDFVQRQKEIFGNIKTEKNTKEKEISKEKIYEKNENKDIKENKDINYSDEITMAIEKLANLEGQQAILRSRMNLDDLLVKSQTITNETIRLQSEVAKKQMDLENTQLKSYEAFARIQIATEESKVILADMQQKLAPAVEKGVNLLEKSYDWLKNSKFGKWAGGVFK